MATDVRVTVTKKILKDSLIQLMQTTSFDKITIKDICISSGVSRSTFYSHYEDIYSLLADFEKDLFESYHLESFMNDYETSPEKNHQSLVDIFKQVAANADFYKIYLNNMHAGYITDELQRISRQMIDYWMKQNIFRNRADAQYYFLFYKSGMIAVVKEWLQESEDVRKTPKELADTLSLIMSINIEI